jgi:hypothetical protein
MTDLAFQHFQSVGDPAAWAETLRRSRIIADGWAVEARAEREREEQTGRTKFGQVPKPPQDYHLTQLRQKAAAWRREGRHAARA